MSRFISESDISSIIAHNNAYKYHGVTDDLVVFDNKIVANTNCVYDRRLYAVRLEDRYERLHHDIRQSIEQKFDFSRLNMSNLLIAGGSISQFIIGEQDIKDFDIFIYGDVDPRARIYQFLYDISCLFHDLTGNNRDLVIYKTPFIIDVIKDRYPKIQIILRHYKSISEILHGFDISPSAVGYDYDTGKLYMTTMAKFTYETGCMPVDLSYRSVSYEARLSKYINRKFCMVYLTSSEIIKKLHTRTHIIAVNIYGTNVYDPITNSHILQLPLKYRKISDYANECIGNTTSPRTTLLNKRNTCIQYDTYTHQFIINAFSTFNIEKEKHHFCIEVGNEIASFKSDVYCYCYMTDEDKKQFIEMLERKIEYNCKSYDSIKINALNPMTQLTGSFNMDVISENKWLLLNDAKTHLRSSLDRLLL
jgi:hypothetical protein